QNLHHAPGDVDAGTRARSPVINKDCQCGPCKKSTEVRCVANETATYETDEQVNEDDRQQPGSEYSFETFRKFATILDTKHKEDANQSKQCSGGPGGRSVH